MKSVDFFALSFALAGTACFASQAYDAHSRSEFRKQNGGVVHIKNLDIDESYIVSLVKNKEKRRIALAEFNRKKNIASCKMDTNCRIMAEAIYFEARGENPKGQISVGQVILERTKRAGFPNSVYGVVHQKSDKGICHFSYVCEIEQGVIQKSFKNGAAYTKALEYAYGVMKNKYPKYVKNADHYYNPDKVSKTPHWVAEMGQVAKVGNHLFLSSNRNYVF